MRLNLADRIHRWGIWVGAGLFMLPFLYDIGSIFYGRKFYEVKICEKGLLIMTLGFGLAVWSAYYRVRYGKPISK